MENLPFYISGGFIATTLLTLFFVYRASRYNKAMIIFAIAWLLLQGGLTRTGFYQVSGGVPPRFSLLLIPPVLLIIGLFITKRGRAFLDGFDAGQLTLLHIVRLPVELILFALCLYHYVPNRMTFEGGNLDILSGLSAPFIFYFGYRKSVISRKWLLAWNIVCLLLLVNIVSRAVLSFGQPNLALFYFPFSWLPCFVVPVVLLAQVLTIRKLIQGRE
ncbi:MAG: hypothetical protein V4592_23765 [Bacteroidota bacterium]